MIKKLTLNFGSATKQPPLSFETTPVTIFVGPNNAGKSRVLVEIENGCREPEVKENNLILKELEFHPLSKPEIEEELRKIEQKPGLNETLNPDHVIIGKVHIQSDQPFRQQLYKKGIVEEAQKPPKRLNYYSTFLSLYTVRLDGTSRLNLLNEKKAGDLKNSPTNHLTHLFQNNDLRKKVRDIIHAAFSKYFVIDPTNIGNLSVRLSDREPRSEREEKGWETESVDFHKSAVDIKNMGDGVKAFTGIITTLLAGDPKITLIDEPEAFLHPALSSILGKEICKSLSQTSKCLFVATHSSSFLMGCIQSGVPLNIVRLTYNYDVPTARLLPKGKILKLMRKPLLRSTGVLNGLFYESVVVTEADSDRAFYQEINERLLLKNDSRGIPNCLFINAQNKQTVWEIVRPLRELGIPTVGIVDIDVIKDGGQVWSKPLDGAFIPPINQEPLHNQRERILNAFSKTKKNMKRDGGINLLNGQDREGCQNLFSQLQDYGIFIVKYGELESWLKHLGATRHGSDWLIDIFEKMGEDPEKPGYVIPENGDVWDFIGEIKQWISNPERKGVPVSTEDLPPTSTMVSEVVQE